MSLEHKKQELMKTLRNKIITRSGFQVLGLESFGIQGPPGEIKYSASKFASNSDQGFFGLWLLEGLSGMLLRLHLRRPSLDCGVVK